MPSDPLEDVTEKALAGAGLELREGERELIRASAAWPNAWASVAASIYPSRLLERSIEAHASALKQASDSADRLSTRLLRATWALVGVTFALVLATVALVLTAAR